MSLQPPYDPRAIANALLERAKQERLQITNVALQKLLYFAHGLFLIRTGKPLVSGYFEAWNFGPVHPTVYHAFKASGREPITEPALARNVMTGETSVIPTPSDDEVDAHLAEVLRSYGRLSPGRLIEITHARGGPWDFVVNKAKTSVALGMRISDKVTVEKFKYQKVSVGPVARFGDLDEDSPLA